MKKTLSTLGLVLVLVACGDQENFKQDNDSYQIDADFALRDSVNLSFEQFTLYKSVSVGAAQSDRCRSIAADFSATRSINLDVENLKVLHQEPSRRCARQEFTGNCATYQYVHTFTCQFSVKN